jgi:hypothetical protein
MNGLRVLFVASFVFSSKKNLLQHLIIIFRSLLKRS